MYVSSFCLTARCAESFRAGMVATESVTEWGLTEMLGWRQHLVQMEASSVRGAPKAAVTSGIVGTGTAVFRWQENLLKQLQQQRIYRMEEVLAVLRTGLYLHQGQDEDVFSMMETKRNGPLLTHACFVLGRPASWATLGAGSACSLQSRVELQGMCLGPTPETLCGVDNALSSSPGPGLNPESSPALAVKKAVQLLHCSMILGEKQKKLHFFFGSGEQAAHVKGDWGWDLT